VTAYLPHNLAAFSLLVVVLLATLFAGLALTRFCPTNATRCAGWVLVVASTAAAIRLSDPEPAGLRMLALIGVLLWSMKAVVSVESQAAGQPRLSSLRWLAFATSWFGMRPALFAARGPGLPGAFRLFGMGCRRMAVGLTLITLARLTWAEPPSGLSEDGRQILATLFLLPGLCFVLHLGIFNLLAGAWRLGGIDCRPLFRSPLRSRSLTEFWGRRWNLGFSEMTALAVYRPVACRLGKGTALFAAFLFSGLVHELAISVPVRAGYGLPMLYFTLHGILMLLERWLERIGRPIQSLGWPAHLWTLGWLAAPLPILFHPAFLQGIVWPLIGMAS
jgi:alginate O-acetyltransferase complex protein AlgI